MGWSGNTYTRPSNSFSVPVLGTEIDPTDADTTFDAYDAGLTAILAGTAGAFTAITCPSLIGGTATTGTLLTFKTTTGVGTTDAFVWKGGNNGATTFATLNATKLDIPQTTAATTTTTGALTVGGGLGVAADVFAVNVVGTTSLIAASATNGITLTQANIARNAAAGSMTISAGSNAGNNLIFATGGSNRGSISDSLFDFTIPMRVLNGTAIPAGGTAGVGYSFSSTSNFGVYFGSGAPSLAAAKGSLYLRSDGGGTGDRAYINTNGSTTWTALTTAA